MKRIARAILEIDSFRSELPLVSASDMVAYGLATTAIGTLQQIEMMAAVSPRLARTVETDVDQVAEIIRQVNVEAGDRG